MFCPLEQLWSLDNSKFIGIPNTTKILMFSIQIISYLKILKTGTTTVIFHLVLALEVVSVSKKVFLTIETDLIDLKSSINVYAIVFGSMTSPNNKLFSFRQNMALNSATQHLIDRNFKIVK